MNPFSIISGTYKLILFAITTRDFIAAEPEELDGYTDLEIEQLSEQAKKIVYLGALSILGLAIVIPILIPWYLYFAESIRTNDAWGRTAIIFIFSPLFAIAAIFFAVSGGLLISSRQFLESKFGEKWMLLVGVNSTLGCRIVCFIGMLLLGALFAGYYWFLFNMHPT